MRLWSDRSAVVPLVALFRDGRGVFRSSSVSAASLTLFYFMCLVNGVIPCFFTQSRKGRGVQFPLLIMNDDTVGC